MKSLLFAVIGCFLMSGLARAEGVWLTDYDQAVKKAKAENKALLMDFTGSDWCPPCMALKKNVFDKPEFQKYADKNLILLEVDFPQGKPQTKEQAEANLKLAQRYGVAEGMSYSVPQVIILDKNAKQLVHYGPENPMPRDLDSFMAALKSTLK